jgi:hypothetical protein
VVWLSAPRLSNGGRLAAAALLVTLAVCACGGSSKRAGLDAICRSGALSAFAHDLGVDTASVSFGHSTGGNGMPQCTFSADAMDRHISALVNIDDGPQVEFRIERTLVEAQQLFGPPPPHWMPPIGLYRLGPYAAWYPVLQTLTARICSASPSPGRALADTSKSSSDEP